MKLSKMALSNIKHNIKNYVMYFFAMCFSVFTTYSFLSLVKSDSVSEKLGQSMNYSMLFIVFSVVILIFVLFFLISSNNSFIRARKKEISTYALFGMENSKIGKLLFLETLILGTVAIIVGITFGVFFSKLTTMILLKMTMSAYSGDISFTIEFTSIIITVAIFFGIFSLMGLSGLRVINKFKLVDLFKGSKVSEGKTKCSYIMLIISLVLIIGGYYWAFTLEASMVVKMMLIILVIVVVGTYMFFWGGFQKVLYLLKLNKRVFYKNSNLVATSLLSHRIKTMSTTMATIAILVAIGTTAISFGYTLFEAAEQTTYRENTFDLYFYSDDKDLVDDVRAVIEKHDSTITDEIHFERYVSQPKAINFPEEYNKYLDGEDYFENFLGVYSESQYNKIVDISKDKGKHLEVEKGDAIVFYNYNKIEYDWGKSKIAFSDRQLDTNIIEGYDYSYGRMLIAVLNDEDFDELLTNGEIATKINKREYWPLTGINYTKSFTSTEIAEELNQVLEGRTGSNRISYYTYNELISLFGLLCFIGFFMCAIFILMTASMLYFKQVTIATEERAQYKMLKKIGLDSDMESKIIKKRLLPIFFTPLLLGIMHSVFAMKAADTLIFSMLIPIENSYINVLMTSGVMYLVYAAVYTVFYFVTKNQYKRILK